MRRRETILGARGSCRCEFRRADQPGGYLMPDLDAQCCVERDELMPDFILPTALAFDSMYLTEVGAYDPEQSDAGHRVTPVAQKIAIDWFGLCGCAQSHSTPLLLARARRARCWRGPAASAARATKSTMLLSGSRHINCS